MEQITFSKITFLYQSDIHPTDQTTYALINQLINSVRKQYVTGVSIKLSLKLALSGDIL